MRARVESPPGSSIIITCRFRFMIMMWVGFAVLSLWPNTASNWYVLGIPYVASSLITGIPCLVQRLPSDAACWECSRPLFIFDLIIINIVKLEYAPRAVAVNGRSRFPSLLSVLGCSTLLTRKPSDGSVVSCLPISVHAPPSFHFQHVVRKEPE
jgi:hypothetical protein